MTDRKDSAYTDAGPLVDADIVTVTQTMSTTPTGPFKVTLATLFAYIMAKVRTALGVVTAASSSSGTLTINCALGYNFTYTFTENITAWTISNVPAGATTLFIGLTQHASSAKTMAMDASFKWAGGSVGVVSAGLGAKDYLALTTLDGGTTWAATLSKGHA